MDDFMKSILSRVLSEEIGNQEYWADLEEQEVVCSRSYREDNVNRIKQFMKDNSIEFKRDYYMSKRYGSN